MDSSRQAGGGQRKRFGSADTTYYPDLVDGGGLTSVLQAVAVAGDYDVGRIDGQSSGEFGGYVQAVIDTGTGKVLFGIAADRRVFSITIFVGSLEVASGGTSEIPGVLAVAAAWRSGISYEEIEARFPFMHVLELARVLVASDPVAAMWDWLLGDEVFASWRPVVEGAHRHPVLRRFFPDFQLHKFTLSRGHSRQPGDARPPDDGVVAIWPIGPDGYGVERWGTRPARADCPSLDEALAAAARLLTGQPGTVR